MTAQSSSKGLFGTYFKYRLGVMKINFALCCILNVLGLPLFAVAANVGFGGVVSEFAETARIFSIICIGALPVVAVFNAPASFDYYHKKDLTDTIGALPLNHKQRFFADLLAGLVVNAAPIVPCGIFCTIVFASMQGKLLERYEAAVGSGFLTVRLGLYIAATVLLIVVFTYLFAVLTSVCCGKVFHSAVFAVVAIVTLPLLFGGLARCFANAIRGIDSGEYYLRAFAFFPPVGLLRPLFDAMDAPFSSYGFILEEGFASFGFARILVYLLLAAGIIAGAYFLSKRRLAEHTGSAFAIKPMFWVLSGGLTAAITISALNAMYELHEPKVYYHLISAAIGILVCLVTILFYRQSKRTFLRSLIVGAGAVALMLAAWVVIDKTGAFGARYYPKNADKIEYVKINNTYTITDKNDIERFTSMFNEELRDDSIDLAYESRGGFFVEVKKTNGKSTLRGFNNADAGEKIFLSLDGYIDLFFEELERAPEDWSANLPYTMIKNPKILISDEDVPELINILHEEAKEKHDPNAKVLAEVVFSNGGDRRSFVIEENYTRTIAFLTETNKDPEIDSALSYLSIEYNIYGEDWDMFSIDIPFGDKDDERVKELISVLEDCEGEELIRNFKINGLYASEAFGVTEKNKARVLELMKQLAADYFNG